MNNFMLKNDLYCFWDYSFKDGYFIEVEDDKE